MALITAYQLPRFIVRGEANSLDMDVYSAAGAQQTASSGTITVYASSRTIVDAAAVTAGAPSTYTLAAASVPTTESLSDRWLEVWDLDIGTFTRPAYLVRRQLFPTLQDSDLTDLHSDLADLRDPDQSTFEAQREAAWVKLNRGLIKRGRRPELVIDSWALTDLHRALTLEIIFQDFAGSATVGAAGRYQQLADHYREEAAREWDTIVFRYDADEDGTADDANKLAGTPIVFLNRPPEWHGRN